MKSKLNAIVLSALLIFGASTTANATIYTTQFTAGSSLDFSSPAANLNLVGSPPSGSFASLAFNSITNQFTLSAFNLDDFFGSNSFINSVYLDLNVGQGVITPSIVSGGGVTNIGVSNSGSAPAGFTRFDFIGADQELQDNESVTFNLAGLNPNCLTGLDCSIKANQLLASSFAVAVVNRSPNPDQSVFALGATIDPASAVPEAETSAMFFVGLGLLGFVSRRRK